MKSNFERALRETLKWEGGWADHPLDPGGKTMKGVTQKVYDHWRRKNGRDLRSVREITDEELKAIYRFQYWDLVHGDKLPPGVDLAVFDFSVHSGPTRAVRTLQRVLGLRQDGDLGAVTADSLLEHDPVEIIHRLCDARLAFMKGLSTWRTFGKGWNRRVISIRSACVSMTGGDATEFPRLAGLGIMGDGLGEEDEGDQGSARASADPRDFAVMSTTGGRGAVTAGLGTAGAALTEAADSISFVSEHSEILKAIFVALLVGGIGMTVYAQIRSIKTQTPE